MGSVVVFEDSPEHLRQIGQELGRAGHVLVGTANTLPSAYSLLGEMIKHARRDSADFRKLTAVVLAGSVSHGLPRERRPDFVGPPLYRSQDRRGRAPWSPHKIPYYGHLSDAEMVLDVLGQYNLARPQDRKNPGIPVIGVSRGSLVPAGVRPELDLTKHGIPRLGEMVTMLALEQQPPPQPPYPRA